MKTLPLLGLVLASCGSVVASDPMALEAAPQDAAVEVAPDSVTKVCYYVPTSQNGPGCPSNTDGDCMVWPTGQKGEVWGCLFMATVCTPTRVCD